MSAVLTKPENVEMNEEEEINQQPTLRHRSRCVIDSNVSDVEENGTLFFHSLFEIKYCKLK